MREAIRGAVEIARAMPESIFKSGSTNARHTRRGDREAIQHHYDVSNEFYQLWLDPRMVYSCAYFRKEGDSLETAQAQKLDHICTKLRLHPGERFLDIGCGWGALAIRAASKYGVDATGITLSENQFQLAQPTHPRSGGSRTDAACCCRTTGMRPAKGSTTRSRAWGCSSTWDCETCPCTSAPCAGC